VKDPSYSFDLELFELNRMLFSLSELKIGTIFYLSGLPAIFSFEFLPRSRCFQSKWDTWRTSDEPDMCF